MKTIMTNAKPELDIEAIMSATDDSMLADMEAEIAALEATVEKDKASAESHDAELEALLGELEDDAEKVEAVKTEDADLEALLEGLEDDAATEAEEVAAATEADSIEGILHASLEEIEDLTDDSEAGKAKKAERLSKATPAKSKTAAAMFDKASAHIRAKLGEKVYEYAVFSQEVADMSEADRRAAIDAWLLEVDKAPKKVREKVVNLLMTLAGHATLSCYTQIAVDMLYSMKALTINDIRMRYLKRPYSAGASSSQSSQMNTLLPLVGLSKVSGKQHVAVTGGLLELLVSK